MSINKKTARIKAKIYVYSQLEPMCWYEFERKRKQNDDYIIRDMAKRINAKFQKDLKMVIFYSNEKNPEIGVSYEIARLNPGQNQPEFNNVIK